MTELSFQEMLHEIRRFQYPTSAAFVTVWWWDFAEATQIIHLLKSLGYKVTTYKAFNEIEIRFHGTGHPQAQ